MIINSLEYVVKKATTSNSSIPGMSTSGVSSVTANMKTSNNVEEKLEMDNSRFSNKQQQKFQLI